MNTQGHVQIVSAESSHAAEVHRLVCELADFEHLREAVVSTVNDIRQALELGDMCAVLALAEDGTSLGLATYYLTYSTFRGKPGLYIEDLYVPETQRGTGIGYALFSELSRIALDHGCYRMSWEVLDWNIDARRFYERLGASHSGTWLPYTLALPMSAAPSKSAPEAKPTSWP